MNGNCHFVFGAALGTALSLNMELIASALPNLSHSPETTTLFVMGGILGGIFPDIDNPASYFGKLASPISKAVGSFGKLTGKTGKNHRGIMHDPIVYLAGLVFCYFCFTPLVGFFVGCLSHLFLDMFNPSGIPFLFGAAHLHLGKIVSGSKSSVIFTWISVALVLLASLAVKTEIILKITNVLQNNS